jgi:hypothetical protein
MGGGTKKYQITDTYQLPYLCSESLSRALFVGFTGVSKSVNRH